MGPARELVPSL